MSERTFALQLGSPIGSPHPERPLPTITVPADATDDEIHRQAILHALAALGEGVCPHCAWDLRPAIGDTQEPRSPGAGRPWLYCQNCPCYWSADHTQQLVTWEAWWAWKGADPFPNVNEDGPR
ncbi:hypothetical protein [Streptosporangium longisporum]